MSTVTDEQVVAELARIFHLRFWPGHFFASVAKFVILSDYG